MSQDSHHSSTETRPRRPRRRLRRLVHVTLGLMLGFLIVVGLGWFVVTRSWFMVWAIDGQLEQAWGGPVEMGEAKYLGNGRFRLRQVQLRAPGYHGDAGEVVFIAEAHVAIDTDAVFGGNVRITSLELDDARLRLAEHADRPGEFSFMALQPQPMDDDGEPVQLPTVQIRNSAVEVGIIDGQAFVPRAHRLVAGEMYPASGAGQDETHLYGFELGEIDATGSAMDNGLRAWGEWNARTLEQTVTVEGIRLDDTTYDMCPRFVQAWWKELDIDGEVADATFHWSERRGIEASLDVEGVALSIPLEAEGLWARYRSSEIEPAQGRPRMRDVDCEITFRRDTLTMHIVEGEFGSDADASNAIGCAIDLQLTVPAELGWEFNEAWMQNVIALSAFRAAFDINEFALDRNVVAGTGVDMPLVLAQLLHRFDIEEGTLKSSIAVERATPIVDGESLTAAPVQVQGSAELHSATGRYEKFPYLLEDVEASISFTHDAVTIDSLRGQGSGDATMHVTGEVRPPGRGAGVNLFLTAENLQLDARFREALDEGALDAFDHLFDRSSFDALNEANLIENASDITQLKQERDELQQQRQAMLADAIEHQQTIEDINRELKRLDRRIEAGPFVFGGMIDLDLNITRNAGSGQPTVMTGDVHINRAGLVPRDFPYPVQITQGTLRWGADGIEIMTTGGDPTLSVVMPGHGSGSLSGRIDRSPQTGWSGYVADLQLKVEDDTVNETLLRALPDSESNETQRIVRGLGVGGLIDYSARIVREAGVPTDFQVDLDLHAGTVDPEESMAERLSGIGLLLPPDIRINDVSARLNIEPGLIELLQMTGTHHDAMLTSSGTIDMSGASTASRFTAEVKGLSLDRYIVDLLPGQGRAQLEALWNRYSPKGWFDVSISYDTERPSADRLSMDVFPSHVDISIDGEPARVVHRDGSLRIESKEVDFLDLSIDLESSGDPVGRLTLAGSYGVADNGALKVVGHWRDAELNSPFIAEALLRTGMNHALAQYQMLRPSGAFDASFNYESATNDQPHYFEMELQPRSLAISNGEKRIEAELDAGSKIRVTTESIEFDGLAGETAGAQFDLDGRIALADTMEAELQLQYTGDWENPTLQSFVPAGVREALASVEFHTSTPVRIDPLNLHITQTTVDDPDPWNISLQGSVHVHDATLRAGIAFDQIRSRLDVAADYANSQMQRLELRAEAPFMRAADRVITDVKTELVFDATTQELKMLAFRGDSYGGVINGEAIVGFGEQRSYSIRTELIDVGFAGFSDPLEHRRSGAPDHQRGSLYGDLALQGLFDQPSMRSGRGKLRILNGELASFPVALRIVEVLSLSPPVSDSVDYADVDFFIAGDQVELENIHLESEFADMAAFQLMGFGTMTIDDFELDLRLAPRGMMPVFGWLMSGLSGELYEVRVEGPLSKPEARLRMLPRLAASSDGTAADNASVNGVAHADAIPSDTN